MSTPRTGFKRDEIRTDPGEPTVDVVVSEGEAVWGVYIGNEVSGARWWFWYTGATGAPVKSYECAYEDVEEVVQTIYENGPCWVEIRSSTGEKLWESEHFTV